MTDSTEPSVNGRSRVGWKLTLLFCCLILLAAAGLTAWIFSTEPKAERGGATKKTAMLVETLTAERSVHRPKIEVMGSVVPTQDIVLRPRVTGRIIDRAPEFTPGGFVSQEQKLLQIDPADYRNTLRQRKSELQQAETELKLERGRQTIARKDYQLMNQDLSGENKELVLRQPQLEAARARVDSARAAVEQARLELERTSITAPFDAQIISRQVNLGSQVSAGDVLGRLVGLETYWVEATIPLSKLSWLSFADSDDEEGSKALIHNRSAWPEGAFRTGRLQTLVGALDRQTRMARALITVDDPLARGRATSEGPPLLIGSFVQVRLQAGQIEDVVRLNRDYVRKNETVWVMKDGRLDIRDVQVVFRDAEYAYIDRGLTDGEQIVTTNLASVVDGARLRLKSPQTPSSGQQPQSSSSALGDQQ